MPNLRSGMVAEHPIRLAAAADVELSHPLVTLVFMQQSLIFELEIDDSSTDWRLDEETKATGRRGIAEARRRLDAVIPAAA